MNGQLGHLVIYIKILTLLYPPVAGGLPLGGGGGGASSPGGAGGAAPGAADCCCC